MHCYISALKSWHNSGQKPILNSECTSFFEKVEIFDWDQNRLKMIPVYTKAVCLTKTVNLKSHKKIVDSYFTQDWLLTCDEQDNNVFNAFAKELV